MLNIILQAVSVLLEIIIALIIVRCVLSWLPLNQSNRIISAIYTLTEPIMGPCRALLNKFSFFSRLPVDFSPIIALFLVYALLDIVNLFRT